MIYYLTKFPPSYRDRRFWGVGSKDRAKAFMKHIREKYGVRGKLVKVKECK